LAVGTGAESSSVALADKIDFSWKWTFIESAHLLIGGAVVLPGAHLKALRDSTGDPGYYTYVQTGTKF